MELACGDLLDLQCCRNSCTQREGRRRAGSMRAVNPKETLRQRAPGRWRRGYAA